MALHCQKWYTLAYTLRDHHNQHFFVFLYTVISTLFSPVGGTNSLIGACRDNKFYQWGDSFLLGTTPRDCEVVCSQCVFTGVDPVASVMTSWFYQHVTRDAHLPSLWWHMPWLPLNKHDCFMPLCEQLPATWWYFTAGCLLSWNTSCHPPGPAFTLCEGLPHNTP